MDSRCQHRLCTVVPLSRSLEDGAGDYPKLVEVGVLNGFATETDQCRFGVPAPLVDTKGTPTGDRSKCGITSRAMGFKVKSSVQEYLRGS